MSANKKLALPMSSAVDWCSLPAELLQTIAGDLETIADYIRFRSVCRFWRSAAELRPEFVPQEFPRLMLPLTESSNRGCFFNPLTNSQYGRPLPEVSTSHRCIGSYLGRVILIDDSPSPDVVVLNPITGEKTSLPPLSSFPGLHHETFKTEYTQSRFFRRFSFEEIRDQLLTKVILTPNSTDPNNFSAFAIPSAAFNHLVYCKYGDPSWRRVDDSRTLGAYKDAIYFRGKLYLVNGRRSLATCDFKERDTPIMNYITCDFNHRVGVGVGANTKYLLNVRKYLLDVMGELLLVERYLDWGSEWVYHTVKFCVFKFDWSAQEWMPVTSVGDSVLFVGYNSSFAIKASEYSGYKGNRIYFADDYIKEYYQSKIRRVKDDDVGVYNFADGRIQRIPLRDRKKSSPLWFKPSLW